ncbi:DnaB-like helicase C-terminal domain-containing protein [Lutibacter sp.]|uniref:DnaB-like helicase C-terminal domain-containing protein n=1 Tax=Lutibacter sp. TaxID=1925666 RepID=UPI001A1AE977|nr:DnaB-like helicase C-terminal domain-containing protein [Lutibacter sp.]MBI9041951.1 hypothetical protein [Lutibacter sp.]
MMTQADKNVVFESIVATIDDERLISEMKILLEVEPEPIKSLNYYLKNYRKQLVEDEMSNDSFKAINTGLSDFDNHTGGWKMGTLNIVAAHKGNGLRAFLISILDNIAIKNKQEVAVFGLISLPENFINHIIASETAISVCKIHSKLLEKHEIVQLDKKIDQIIYAPIFIDGNVPLTVIHLKNKIKQLIKNNNLKIALIENLEAIAGKRELVLKDLNNLAEELQIPIVAFYELPTNWIERLDLNYKPSYTRFKKKYSDIAFHDDLETLTLIYRREYYGLTKWEDNTSCEGQAELICYGKSFETKNIRIKFIAHLAKFVDLDC